jgi:hypothetical protein
VGLPLLVVALWMGPRPVLAVTQTVTGRLVCLACYARNARNVDLDHDRGRACAMACVRWRGNPVGLVTAQGKVYQLAGAITADSNVTIAPHLARTVTVSGEIKVKDGMTMLAAADIRAVR